MKTKEDILLINKTRKFAINCHGKVNQLYDGMPYYTHLDEVVNYAKKFKHLIPEKDHTLAVCGAWCHDTLEDGNITYNDLRHELNDEIADIVFLLTNHRGKTRKERANDDYYLGIKNNDIALYVKICDRLGNMTHSILYNNRGMADMYVKELPHFKNKLYNGLYDEMWDLLQELDNGMLTKNYYFPDIDKFDEDNICYINLPKPIPFQLYNELYEKGIIRKDDLIKNCYYMGDCRNTTVALWNGFEFVYMRTKFKTEFVETIKHIEDDNGFDLFLPFKELKDDEVDDNHKIKY